jgi:ArsR family transcriptional regulator, arsenate/arsenite/antimonite-responsive transcriptional repressor
VPRAGHRMLAVRRSSGSSIPRLNQKSRMSSVELTLAPKHKRPKGEVCCEPIVRPDIDGRAAVKMAQLAKALGDPIRIQLLDVLRKHAGKVCVCELVPLFDVAQPTVSHHLRVLREAGLVGYEKQGIWAYYYVLPDGFELLTRWLS